MASELDHWDELKERIILLKRFLAPYLESSWPDEVKRRVSEQVFGGRLPLDKPVDVRELAKVVTDEQLKQMITLSPLKDYYSFRGRYYTVKNGAFSRTSSWEEVKESVRHVLRVHGRKAYSVLKALIELGVATFEEVADRASKIYGKELWPSRLIAELRDKWDLVWHVGSRRYPEWAMPEEIKPAVSEVLAEFEAKPLPTFSTRDAQREFQEVLRMEEELRDYLEDLVANRLDEVVRFGRNMSPQYLVGYLQDLFGPMLFFDHLLTITQQYSISDTEVIRKDGGRALNTGFNLALFGEPGTGKSFASRDMILGNESLGIPPHGIPGINRYCGGMTPAKFIAVGEAYSGRRFNFIVTEFNDWFKYRGMVEPLKLAMERGVIRYETKSYVVGPYRFTSFFSVNYNTRVYERGYEVTVRDPNFNAIEDRMLCRLHRLTKERYQEIARSQRDLMFGKLRAKMEAARNICDHLTLVYAIQTEHPLVADTFHKKRVLITDTIGEVLGKATELVLEYLNARSVPFSPRLEWRALQLASAMSLTKYFSVDSDVIPIDEFTARMAARFYVEEAWVRSQESFPLDEVLKKLGLKEVGP